MILTKIIFSIVTKKEEETLMLIFFFNTARKKLKIDNENEIISEKIIGDVESKIVKIVPSHVIGEIMQGFGVV